MLRAAYLFLALVAGMLVSMGAKAPAPLVTHQAALHLGFTDGGCSGTAIGPGAILSAAHCFQGGALVKVSGKPCTQVGEAILDGNDHAIIRVTCFFPQWATISQTPLLMGQSFRFWGHPGGLHGIFRRGYVMGFESGWTLSDVQCWNGDSGAGIFDREGRVVSVVSTRWAFGENFHGMGSKPLAFTKEQLASMYAPVEPEPEVGLLP